MRFSDNLGQNITRQRYLNQFLTPLPLNQCCRPLHHFNIELGGWGDIFDESQVNFVRVRGVGEHFRRKSGYFCPRLSEKHEKKNEKGFGLEEPKITSVWLKSLRNYSNKSYTQCPNIDPCALSISYHFELDL